MFTTEVKRVIATDARSAKGGNAGKFILRHRHKKEP